MLKKVYTDQGDDKKAIIYFLKEKDLEREALFNNIFAQQINSRFQFSWYKKNRLLTVYWTGVKGSNGLIFAPWNESEKFYYGLTTNTQVQLYAEMQALMPPMEEDNDN